MKVAPSLNLFPEGALTEHRAAEEGCVCFEEGGWGGGESLLVEVVVNTAPSQSHLTPVC